MYKEEQLNTNNWFNFQLYYNNIASFIPDGSTLVEVGVWKGHSISYLAEQLKLVGKLNCKIYAVDLWENVKRKDELFKEDIEYIYDIYNENLNRADVRNFINDIKGFSWDGAKNFEDESVDFCYIDADHHYESVLKDLTAWYPKVKSGGILSGHDYNIMKEGIYSVKKALEDFFKDKEETVTLSSDKIVWQVIKK